MGESVYRKMENKIKRVEWDNLKGSKIYYYLILFITWIQSKLFKDDNCKHIILINYNWVRFGRIIECDKCHKYWKD